MPISPYRHRCLIKDGDCAGNSTCIEVDENDYEYSHDCWNCGEPLVSTRTLLAYIYGKLLGN